ncbi:hypothetical protein LINPERPRIM_LOCUS14514 [Linum perenne]
MYWRFATPTCNSSIIQRVGKALLMMDEFFVMHCLDLMGLGSHKVQVYNDKEFILLKN